MSAFVTLYREEYVAMIEQTWSSLKVGCVNEAMIKGQAAVFLVAGSGGSSVTAVTRGANGQIPYGAASNTQNTCTLVEKHAPFEMTGFNVFATQGDQKRVMQQSSVAVMNRDIDLTIIAEMDNASHAVSSTATTASVAFVAKAKGILGNNAVDTTDAENMYAVVSPGFMAYLMQTTEFANAMYVDVKPFAGPTRRMLRWYGVNWIESPALTGNGTSSEKCYMWHKNAIGHAANVADMDVTVGYDEKQDVSWSRASVFHGAKLLQQTGIIQMLHDGSAFAGT